MAVPKCPVCRAELTDKQVKTIQGTYAQSKRTVRAGGRPPLTVPGVIAALNTLADSGVKALDPRHLVIKSRGKS